MRTESHNKIEAFTIFDAPKLDPIYVVFHDAGPGCGRLTIDCFGWAWSAYWGAIGDDTVREFVSGCGVDYLVNKLTNFQRHATKRETDYLRIIVEALKASLGKSEGVST